MSPEEIVTWGAGSFHARPEAMRRIATFVLLLSACTAPPPPESAPARVASSAAARVSAAVDALAAETLAGGRTPGLSIGIMQGSETLLMRGYGYADAERRLPATAETRYRIASLSKQFVAAAVMQLVERGEMRVEDPVTRYVPEFAGWADGVTIHHLLTHTSGLPGGPVPPWDPEMTRQVPSDETLQRLRATPIADAPGERWVYNNSAYFILGAVLERVTKRPYPDSFRDQFFQPLGMASTVYCEEPPPVAQRAKGYVYDEDKGLLPEPTMNMSVVGAGGSFCSTVGDLLRWQRALTGGRIVTPQSYAKMTTPVTLDSGATEPYGYGLGIRPVDGERGIAHGGGIISFWSYLSYYPDRDLHIAVLINSGGLPSRPFAEELARRVFAAMDEPEALQERKP